MISKGRDDVSGRVRAFYENCSFPGYEEFETPVDLAEKAKRGVYAKSVDAQLPLGVKVLDAGCGTGQLANFLSIMNRTVLGVDFSYNSLAKANQFKRQFGLSNVCFAQMNLLRCGLKE